MDAIAAIKQQIAEREQSLAQAQQIVNRLEAAYFDARNVLLTNRGAIAQLNLLLGLMGEESGSVALDNEPAVQTADSANDAAE